MPNLISARTLEASKPLNTLTRRYRPATAASKPVAHASAAAPQPERFQVRTSERRSFKRCQYRWLWGYKQGLKPLREANPLWFGQGIHIALAEWYKPGFERGEHPADVFARVAAGDEKVRVPNPDFESDQQEFSEHVAMGIDMLRRYVDTFGKDSDWEMIQPEMSFELNFPHPETGEPNWLQYNGTFDGVFRYVGESSAEMAYGEIWLLENKTAASIQIAHLPLDDQAGSYWALAEEVLLARGILQPGQEISGIMYNFLRKVPEDTRPKNSEGYYCNLPQKQHYLDALTKWAKGNENRQMPSAKMPVKELEAMAKALHLTVLGDVSRQQPSPYFERIPVYRSRAERETMLQRIRDEARHIESARSDRPLLPIIKNPTKDCHWDCEFFRMCQLHEAGADWQEFRDAMFKVWSPYEDHEIKAA